VFVTTGANTSTGGPDVVALRRHRALGGHPGTGSAFRISVSPDGSTVFILGCNASFIPIVAAYDAATGAARWTDTPLQISPASIAVSPDGSRVFVTGQPNAMAVSPDGSKVFVTGFTTPPGACCNDQFVTVAYDAANAADLAVSPAGQAVFVTGFVGVHDGCCDFGTVAYQP
jgi:DNA-binding beta-propeller fold protein YncE